MYKLYVAGFGPGNSEKMTIECRAAIERADIIVGYTAYVDLLRGDFPDKEYLATPMMREVDRCRRALELASQGKCVCVVCSGDGGVYGMASLVLELSIDFPEVDIEVIPGVTAALSGSALLGAPLSHDFAVISLSDLLTPWELIEKRLRAAAYADFAVCLYNPSSKKRHDYLKRACEIMLEEKPGDTVCAIAKNIGRDGESSEIMTLEQLRDKSVDMFTTVFIGNSRTMQIGGRMVTPRGYRNV